MKRFVKDDVFCMTNLRGCQIKVPNSMPFTFFYSTKEGMKHGIRVKIVFDPDTFSKSKCGTLKLCDNWKFSPGPNDKHVSAKAVKQAKQFFKKYLVLFSSVWNMKLPPEDIQLYFQKYKSLEQVISDFTFYDEYKEQMNEIHSIEDLSKFCRDNKLVGPI